jgi:hypothetical protein
MRSSREDELVYRRGLVMGLTMAEVMVLILFALLLLIGAQSRRISEGQKDKDQLVAVAAAMGIGPREIPENFDRLVAAATLVNEVARHAANNEERQTALRDAKELVELGREAREMFGRNAVGQSRTEAAKNFIKSAGDAFSRNGKRFGSSQMWVSDAVNAQEKESGSGRVLPPCVQGPEGKPSYLFTARLFNQQIQLEDRDLVAVRGTEAGVLLEQIVRYEFLNSTDFLQQTSALFEWSKARSCRFFVWIDDATGATEKRLYKERLRTVGQHFYYFEPSESVEGRRGAQ